VGRRAIPALLVPLAAIADGRGAHALAFDALLAAIPFAAVAGLVAFGVYLERRDDALGGLQALLWGLTVALLVLSCAARSPAAGMHAVPPLGSSALAACLAVLALKALVALAPYARLALRPAKP
jgi:hypothetical protein